MKLYKMKKMLCVIGIMFLHCSYIYAQNVPEDAAKPPRCIRNIDGMPCLEAVEGVNLSVINPDVTWQKDGSVIVNTDVTFISGIRNFKYNKLTFPISESTMFLVSPEDFIDPAKTIIGTKQEETGYWSEDGGSTLIRNVPIHGDGTEFNIYKKSLGIYSKDLTSEGTTKLTMFRRTDFNELSPDNNVQKNFMFNLDEDDKNADVLYGASTKNNVEEFNLQQIPFKIHNGFFKKTYESTDFVKNWNKPENARWVDITEYILIAGAIGITEAVAIGYLIADTEMASELFTYGARGQARGYLQLYKAIVEGKSLIYLAAGESLLLPNQAAAIGTLSVLKNLQSYKEAYDVTGTLNNLSIKEFMDVNEIEIPNITINANTTPEDLLISDVYKKYEEHSKACSYNANKKCYTSLKEPTVVKVTAKHTHIKGFKLPGSLKEFVTPYQLFNKNMWHYKSPEFFKDQNLYTANVQVSIKQITDIIPSMLTKDNILMRTIFEGNGAVQLEMDEYDEEKESTFYVYSKGQPQFGNQKIISYKLNNAYKTDTEHLYLWKCVVIGDLPDNKATITLSTDATNPTYLAGDHIVIKNYSEVQLLFVGTGTDSFNSSTPLNYVDENDNTVTLNKPETKAVIDGVLLILDEDYLKNETQVLATESYSLFVGKKGEATDGILTNNMALLETIVPLPDYVFEKDYKIRTLESLEEFVNQNKHLPEVPNQKEYKEQGFYSAGKMIMGQLQNLEELYLHTFTQQDKIEALNTQKNTVSDKLKQIENRITQLEKTK